MLQGVQPVVEASSGAVSTRHCIGDDCVCQTSVILRLQCLENLTLNAQVAAYACINDTLHVVVNDRARIGYVSWRSRSSRKSRPEMA